MRVDNTRISISKTIESAFNTADLVDANYEDVPTADPFFVLPKLEKIVAPLRAGRNAPTRVSNNYWANSQVSLKDEVETGVPARLFRRGLGGSVTKTTVAAGIFDHEFAVLPPSIGDILPSFNIAAILGAADFLLAGLMVDKLKFSQKASERVMYEATLIGSGKFTTPSTIDLPTQPDPVCMDGYATIVKYVDAGASTVNLSSLGTVIEWMVEHDNKVRGNRRRDGDPTQSSSTGTGAFVRKMPRGKYETKASITLDFDDLTYWTRANENKFLTNLSFLMKGPLIANVSGTDYFHEFEIIIPSFQFDSPDTGDDEGDASTPIGIICLEDAVTKGTIKGRMRSGVNVLLA